MPVEYAVKDAPASRNTAQKAGVVRRHGFGAVLSWQDHQALWIGKILKGLNPSCVYWNGEKVSAEDYLRLKLKRLGVSDPALARRLLRRVRVRQRLYTLASLVAGLNDVQRQFGRMSASLGRFRPFLSLLFLLTSILKAWAFVRLPEEMRQKVRPKNLSPEERLKVCKECVYYNGRRCLICGCFMAAKARIPSEICPIGRW